MSIKRLCDVVLSFSALVALLPLLLPVMVVLRLTGEHYIFYVQQRIGLGGRPFGLLKFATMLRDSPKMGTGDITVSNDPRVLPFGRILRKTKINELPQLINVLKGDMSLIGPRPLTAKNFACYDDAVQEVIGRIRPGLSGAGSIVFRDEETMIAQGGVPPEEFYKRVIAPYKGQLEVWYVENRCLLLDCVLTGLTVWVVLFPRSTRCPMFLMNLQKQHQLQPSSWSEAISGEQRVLGPLQNVPILHKEVN